MKNQHSAKQQPGKANSKMQMNGHDHHAMMITNNKKRFYVVSVLTMPIMLLSTII
jgi:Cu2+-exporting ATPase